VELASGIDDFITSKKVDITIAVGALTLLLSAEMSHEEWTEEEFEELIGRLRHSYRVHKEESKKKESYN
jgi:hypothetical protein